MSTSNQASPRLGLSGLHADNRSCEVRQPAPQKYHIGFAVRREAGCDLVEKTPERRSWSPTAVCRLPGLRHLRRALGGYELWHSIHRLTGLFVAAGFAHGLLDGTPFADAQVLRWTFVAIGGTGLAFYAYRELLARYFVPLYDSQVAQVHQAGAGITEIALAPLGGPATFAPGQFVEPPRTDPARGRRRRGAGRRRGSRARQR
jgi:hypothetical protein